MAKLIKKEVEQVMFNVDDKISFNKTIPDIYGRGYYNIPTFGTVIQINKGTVDVEIKNGDVYRVRKNEAVLV
jgi:hypothetical protein